MAVHNNVWFKCFARLLIFIRRRCCVGPFFLSNTTQISSLALLIKSRKNCVYNLNPSGACQSCFMKSEFLFQFVWNEFGQHCMVCVGVSGGHGQLQKLTSGGS